MRTIRWGSLLLAGVLSLSLAAAAFAQGAGAGPRAQTIPKAWEVKLNLNDEQKTKLKAAGDAYRTELASAANLTTPKEKRMAARKARETYDAAVNAALTPDQLKLMATLKEDAKQYSAMGVPGNSMAVMGLSDDQKSKIKTITDKYSPDITKLKADLKAATDKKPVRDQLDAVTAKMMDEVKAVLTPEQLKQLPKPRKAQ
jgi:Spy/CpxP family protein refolding chaperone